MFDQMSSRETEIDEMKSSSTTTSSGIKKTCSDCGTSKTPLWRGGPSGPKSLCNACGIRSRKRRRALLGLTNLDEMKKKKSNKLLKKVVTPSSSSRDDKIGDEEKMWCDVVGMEGLTWRKNRRMIGEEEQAAVLLMAMAYSSVFA